MATVQATTAAFPGFPERLELNGTLGSASLEAGVLQAAFMNGQTLSVGGQQGGGGGADPMAFDHAAHRTVLKDFIDAVRQGREPAVTGRSALAAQQVIEAIMASSRSGTPVALHPLSF
jgi:predicted dehydrogenase